MHRWFASAVLILSACSKQGPPESVPPSVLGEDEDGAKQPTALEGPFGSYEEAPAPHGYSRTSLLDAHPGGPFLDASVLVYKDPAQTEPSHCAVALRLDRGWYVGPSFACERVEEESQLHVEALGVDLAADTVPPEAHVWYAEHVHYDDPKVAGDERDETRTMLIVCRAPTASAPTCDEAVPKQR
jgi:hypothetical protein